MSDIVDAANSNSSTIQYVTVMIANQLFGLPIEQVHDVFVPDRMTRVPLAPPEVAGVLNLRGRIVTAIDMRRRLSLPPNVDSGSLMAVGIEYKGESYGLIIDQVGEVLDLPVSDREPNPTNLDSRWSAVSSGVHRLETQLMVVLDVSRLLESMTENIAA